MSQEKALELFVDIAKLLKKYGPESFESLAEILSSSKMTQSLSYILTGTVNVAKTIPKTERKTDVKELLSIPKAMIKLKREEPRKYRFLMEFYDELTKKAILPSLNDVKEFSRELGLVEVRADARQKAINPLINSLAEFSYDELKTKIGTFSKYRTSDRSLEGWSKIILSEKKEE